MARSEGRALRPKRAADEPPFAWSHELLVEGPGPHEQLTSGGCPLPSMRQYSATSEFRMSTVFSMSGLSL